MLDDNTILQTDATVIAGLLILLTIYSLKYAESDRERRIQKILAAVIVSIIFPFAYSAILTIQGLLDPARFSAVTGFGYVFAATVVIVMLPMLGIKYEQRGFDTRDQQSNQST